MHVRARDRGLYTGIFLKYVVRKRLPPSEKFVFDLYKFCQAFWHLMFCLRPEDETVPNDKHA